MAFDGIVTKVITSELQELSGVRIDKIFQPSKNNVILGLYNNGKNYALNICINSSNYRIHLTTHSKPNPKKALNFCMVLRKHLIGLHIKNIITLNLERVVIIELEGFDDIDDLVEKKLIVELMGKHCNIILLDDENKIIDSIRHIYPNENNEYTRTIIPHQKYSFPVSSKYNFLEIQDFSEFKEKLYDNNFELNLNNLAKHISDLFTGFSKQYINNLIKFLNIINFDDDNLEKLYDYLRKVIFNANTSKLYFETLYDSDNLKDYYLLFNNQNIKDEESSNFHLNFYLDDFYYQKETAFEFKNYRNTVLKLILNTLKKYNQRLLNINSKLENCENMDKYKLYGELITANLYKIKNENIEEIQLENYYDNNNLITIPLDKKYTPAVNAKRFFKKYNKLKNTLEIVSEQKKDTLEELNYLESIVYELENAASLDDVFQIYEEISENVIFKENNQKNSNNQKNDNINKTYLYKNHLNKHDINKNNIDKNSINENSISKNKNISKNIKRTSLTKNKFTAFNPIKYIIDGYTLLIGRNNKENDYLTLKYAKKTDIWLHTKDIHGSHGILITNNSLDILSNTELLKKCAEIVASHSKARNSSNVPVDICPVKYVKKPGKAKPGMVIYTNQITLYVTPK